MGSEQSKDQNNMVNSNHKLQHKSTTMSSVENERKRLKTSSKRQTKNSLKTQYGSTGKATPVALESQIDTNRIHQQHLIEAMIAEISRNTCDGIEGEILCLEAMYPDHEQLHKEISIDQDPLLAFKATTDPDTMYMHKAMCEPNWKEF